MATSLTAVPGFAAPPSSRDPFLHTVRDHAQPGSLQVAPPLAAAPTADKVELSQTARALALHLQGDSPSQIAVALNLTAAVVSADLGITVAAVPASVAAVPGVASAAALVR